MIVSLLGRCDSCGQRTRRSLLPHAKRAGAVVPRGPLGHALMEGSDQRILEGRQRWVGTPARGGAGAGTAGVAPCTPGSRPATRSCALPSGRFPSPPMPCPPRPLRILAVDLGRHHNMRRCRLAIPMRIDRSACSSGRSAWPWGAESRHAKVPGRVPVWRPFQSTKEPFRRVIWAMRRSCMR
jgi:hypothetical protein